MPDEDAPLLPPADQVHVWLARPPALDDAAIAHCASLLSPEELDRVSRFHFAHNRRESAVSRALVRMTLARYLGRPAASFRYRLGPYGKPYVDPPCDLDFNASNHPELVACGVSRGSAVGVDVEPLTRGEQILEVARTVFSEPELAGLEGLSKEARLDRAVSLWTCKEAYIKARGLGMSAPLRDIVLEFPDGQRPTVRFLARTDVPEGWWIETRDVHGCRLAVAVRAEAPATGARAPAGAIQLVVRDERMTPSA